MGDRESPQAVDVGRTAEAALRLAQARAIELMRRHERALRRTARRYSLCADDAEDALQRALEILLTKAPTSDQRELIRWMQTVTKHEALAVRRNPRAQALGRRHHRAATTTPIGSSSFRPRRTALPTRRSAASGLVEPVKR